MTVTAGFNPHISCSSDDTTYNIIGGLNTITVGHNVIKLDVTEFDDAYEVIRGGLKKGRTISLGGYYHADEVGQARIRTLFGTGVACYFQVDYTGAGSTDVDNIQTKVQKYTIKSSNGGKVEWDCVLAMHGNGDNTHHAEAAYTKSDPIAGYSSRCMICDTVGGTYYDVLGALEMSYTVERILLAGEDFSTTYTGAAAGAEQHFAGLLKGSLSISGNLALDATGQAHIRSGIKSRANRFVKMLWDGTNGQICQVLFGGHSIPSVSPDGAMKFSASGTLQAAPTATP
jgi:predicted secreted protein